MLHRIATHVLGRRRFEITGRFGLRPSPGGFATPAFGDGPEIVRFADGLIVRETATGAAYAPVGGSTLRALIALAGADIEREFSVGADTPPLGDPDDILALDAEAAAVIAAWFADGARILDRAVAARAGGDPVVAQLWPEHFDLATNVAVGGPRVNLGVSPGDAYCGEPYLYVGPWDDERPGDAAFWNAPFGAIRRRSELGGETIEAGARFLLDGLARFDRAAD